MTGIEELVSYAKEMNASDIHLICGLPPKVRKDGELIDLGNTRLGEADCRAYAYELAGERVKEIEEIGELDLADTICHNRCRIHIFKQQGVPSVALRILRSDVPVLADLGLPEKVKELTTLHKGIVLVTGETGSGKSTTLAGMLNEINHAYRKHIVTLEDPIEYVYTPDQCAINQREVGKDTVSFSEGLRASLREDPDVILIGEMRDRDTIETAITAAETGHLVFATLHTGSAADSIDRMVQVFPGDVQTQIRLQLSMVLEAVLSQQLIPARREGRVLACELMIVTDAIRNSIRSGKTTDIANSVATSKAIGGQSMDQALLKLFKDRVITRETAIHYAHNKRSMEEKAF